MCTYSCVHLFVNYILFMPRILGVYAYIYIYMFFSSSTSHSVCYELISSFIGQRSYSENTVIKSPKLLLQLGVWLYAIHHIWIEVIMRKERYLYCNLFILVRSPKYKAIRFYSLNPLPPKMQNLHVCTMISFCFYFLNSGKIDLVERILHNHVRFNFIEKNQRI